MKVVVLVDMLLYLWWR